MTPRVWLDPVWLDHDPGPTHPEAPWRLRSILDRRGPGEPATRVATRDELCLAHDPAWVDAVLGWEGQAFAVDEETLGSPGTVGAARRATGAVLDLVDHLLAGGGPGFVAPRPPGHHATRSRGMGYCVVNHVAVGAMYAARRGARVMVLDWDAHWGNGTADIVAGTDVRLVCLHEWDLFPDGGDLTDTAGGSALHLPLREEATEDDALRLIEALVADARPDLLLVSCGFDAHAGDPMSHLAFSTAGYGRLTRAAMEIGQGRVGLVLEGGYDVGSLPACVDACLDALARPEGEWRPRAWAPWVDALVARARAEHPWWRPDRR